MLYIGIDLGTSAVKLLLMDETGRIHKIVSRDYPISFPKAGWSEQNPEDWLRETLKGIGDLIAYCDKGSVAGIGCCGQMHGLVVLNENDEVIRPAILWNDGRTSTTLSGKSAFRSTPQTLLSRALPRRSCFG